MKGKNKLFLILIVGLLSACELINPEEDIPAYIHIDEFKVNNVKSSKITDVWINLDGNILGAYQTPFTIPVLAEGRHELLLRAGIKVNGISATRRIYPLISRIYIDTVFTPGETINLNPSASYISNSNVILNATFEQAGNPFDTTSLSEVPMQEVIEGDNKFVKITLQNSLDVFECITHSTLDIPLNANSYLEMDYKNNDYFVVGLYVNQYDRLIKTTIMLLNPSEEWNKIYIDLNPTLKNYTGVIDYNLMIAANKSDTVNVAELCFDNVKIVHGTN